MIYWNGSQLPKVYCESGGSAKSSQQLKREGVGTEHHVTSQVDASQILYEYVIHNINKKKCSKT